jgi:peptide/nickel transport system permease protein
MALSVPGNVLLEAGLSFLGLGDLTRVTWGRILYDAQANAATINGMWWWVLPPGLSIALLGLGFAFIGSALNTVLFPKMRTR